MRIKNPKLCFNPLLDKKYFDLPDLYDFDTRQMKKSEYEVRNFYQGKDCLSKGGKMFYVTLTYADHALPYFDNNPLFPSPRFSDVQWLLNKSKFREYLSSFYGVDSENIHYFVGTELGEGQGSRGYARNPHYHVIFYLYPQVGKSLSLSGDKFLHLIKYFWQGHYYKYKGRVFKTAQELQSAFPQVAFNSLSLYNHACLYSPFHLKTSMKFGNVQEGSLGCEIVSSQLAGAHTYVSKYAVKDLNHVNLERSVYDHYYDSLHSYLTDMNTFVPTVFDEEFNSVLPDDKKSFDMFVGSECSICTSMDIDSACSAFAESKLKDYRRECSVRVRCSQGLGLCIKDSVSEGQSLVKYETSKGVEYRQLPTYIFRKLYRKYENGSLVKNELGKKYELDSLVLRVQKTLRTLHQSLSFFESSPMFPDSVKNFLNNQFGFKFNYQTLKDEIRFLLSSPRLIDDSVVSRYVFFKHVYEGYSYNVFDDDVPLSPFDDLYARLNSPEYGEVPTSFSEDYSLHPYFAFDVRAFSYFDFVVQVYSRCSSVEREVRKTKADKIKKQQKVLQGLYKRFELSYI